MWVWVVALLAVGCSATAPKLDEPADLAGPSNEGDRGERNNADGGV